MAFVQENTIYCTIHSLNKCQKIFKKDYDTTLMKRFTQETVRADSSLKYKLDMQY